MPKSSLKLSLGMALLAGAALLSGCGSDPVTRTTTTSERTITTPPPMAMPAQSETTTTTEIHR